MQIRNNDVSHELNVRLNKLKNIFDHIESYDSNQNVGLRSIKNIGVWLVAYSLMDVTDQQDIINELIFNSGIKSLDKTLLKNEIDYLIQNEQLLNIISSYELAQGKFSISIHVTPQTHAMIASQIPDFLSKYVNFSLDGNMQQNEMTMIIEMENVIAFSWSKAKHSDSIKKSEYKSEIQQFKEKATPFLFANNKKHNIGYDFVILNDKAYHVARLGVLSESRNQDSRGYYLEREDDLYLIMPAIFSDAAFLQEKYFDILARVNRDHTERLSSYERDTFKTQEDYALRMQKDEEYYAWLMSNQKRMQSPFFKITENKYNYTVDTYDKAEHGKTMNQYEFHFLLHFPKLKEALKTVENRLGIYSVFLGKHILSLPIVDLAYKGERELIYNEKGGEIKNREAFCALAGAGAPGPYSYQVTVTRVTIEFIVSSTYMMICDVQQGLDYYPFNIANPVDHLENVYDKKPTHEKSQSEEKMDIEGSTKPRISFFPSNQDQDKRKGDPYLKDLSQTEKRFKIV